MAVCLYGRILAEAGTESISGAIAAAIIAYPLVLSGQMRTQRSFLSNPIVYDIRGERWENALRRPFPLTSLYALTVFWEENDGELVHFDLLPTVHDLCR
jgi:hypothetical protein